MILSTSYSAWLPPSGARLPPGTILRGGSRWTGARLNPLEQALQRVAELEATVGEANEQW